MHNNMSYQVCLVFAASRCVVQARAKDEITTAQSDALSPRIQSASGVVMHEMADLNIVLWL